MEYDITPPKSYSSIRVVDMNEGKVLKIFTARKNNVMTETLFFVVQTVILTLTPTRIYE